MASAAAKRTVQEDPTVYPVTDDRGVPTLQIFISALLFPLLQRWVASRGKPIFVGMNQFFYWKQFDASERVAPAVYLLPGAPLSARVGAWKVWQTGLVPTFALEIVSSDVDKDYLATPRKYDRLGVKELFVFDPDFTASRDRFRWQVFRRVNRRGLVRVEATNADRVRSRVLGCFLRAVGEGDEVRVRLGTGPNGDTLLPTDEEARKQAEAARTEAERARTEAERARAEAETARTEEWTAREQAETARTEAEAARKRSENELAELRAKVAHGRKRRS